MNLFARGLGGVLSDTLNETMGMRGRIMAQAVLLLFEGIAVLIFAQTDTLAGAVIVLVLFSLFVQSAEGTSYGIVPYVKPKFTGSVTGIVGAGGNVGAVCFGLGFRELNYNQAFNIMGGSIIASAFLSIFISIKGHRGLLHGEDQVVDKETGEVVENPKEGEALLEGPRPHAVI
jgi:NNP family nitrate/nitrite transporter-like MFS transporter